MRTVALLALLLSGLTSALQADEYGPHPAIRAIRAALPVLLAPHLKSLGTPGRLAVPDIVVDGDAALASWNSGSARGLILLNYHPNGWWMTGEAYEIKKDEWTYGLLSNLQSCQEPAWGGVNSGDLQRQLKVPTHLLDLARRHIPEITDGDAEIHAYPGTILPSYFSNCYDSSQGLSTGGGYSAKWIPPQTKGLALSDSTLRGRAPTASEMSPSRGADAVYFFTLQSGAAQKVSVGAGSTLEVWAPFVLDPRLRYTLTLALGDPTIGPLTGRLEDNTLHFTLPAFAVPPSAELMGEIDGDP